jgi:predicted nucleotidyltransferase
MRSEAANTTIYTDEQIAGITREVARAANAELGERLCDVILYGSYARGDVRDWSDIDMMILVHADDLETKRIKDALEDRLWRLIYETNLLLSIIVVSASRYEQYREILPFYSNVERDGRRVYV